MVEKKELASKYSNLMKEIQNYLGAQEDAVRRFEFIAPHIASNTIIKKGIISCVVEDTPEGFLHCLKEKIPWKEIKYRER